MKTRIKVTELDGEIRNIAQSKGYGKIENFFDLVYLLFAPLNGLYWKDIEEPLWVQYGFDDYGDPHSFERAVNVINEFLTDRGLESSVSHIVKRSL